MPNLSFISICSIKHGSLWKLTLRNRMLYIKSIFKKFGRSPVFIFSQEKLSMYLLVSF